MTPLPPPMRTSFVEAPLDGDGGEEDPSFTPPSCGKGGLAREMGISENGVGTFWEGATFQTLDDEEAPLLRWGRSGGRQSGDDCSATFQE